MKEEIYEWMKNLAVFYILFTAFLHLVPDGKYERYVRSFMGLLLIFMLMMPVYSILGKGSELASDFSLSYDSETEKLKELEVTNLQEIFLRNGYEEELEKKVMDAVENTGIKIKDAAVHIEEDTLSAVLYFCEQPQKDQERRMKDALWTACGIGESELQIQIVPDDVAAVGNAAPSGTSSGGDYTSGLSR